MKGNSASSLLISVSGLRGTVGGSLVPEVIHRYVFAFASWVRMGCESPAQLQVPFLISSDGRDSAGWIVKEVQRAFRAAGMKSLDIGPAATPTLGFLVKHYDAPGGVQISASHNPHPWNGLKLFGPAGALLSAEEGLRVKRYYENLALDEFALDADFDPWSDAEEPPEDQRTFSGDPVAYQSPHVDAVLKQVQAKAIRARKFRVFLDSNHGAGCVLGKKLLTRLGCSVVFSGKNQLPDGRFEHEPEPTEANLKDVARAVARTDVDVAFCQDPDADRLAIIAPDGTCLGEECTLPLCVRSMFEAGKTGTVVANCSSSWTTRDVALAAGGRCVVAPVGEANVVAAMREVQAVFGGEGNGGTIHPAVGMVRDSLVAMAMILDLMARTGKSISELVAELPKYKIAKHKVRFDTDLLPELYERLERAFPDAKVDRLDGLRLEWPEAWILVRPSNTEPAVRVIGEAKTARKVNDLCRRVLGLCTDM